MDVPGSANVHNVITENLTKNFENDEMKLEKINSLLDNIFDESGNPKC